MTQVQQLTVQIARLAAILERVEPHVRDLDKRLLELERSQEKRFDKLELKNSWAYGAAAAVGAMVGAATPFLLKLF